MDIDKRTTMILVWELHEQGLNHSQIATRLALHRATVGLWYKAITQQGLMPFLETQGTTHRISHPVRQVPLTIKQKVWQLREREGGCCGQKIASFLEKEEGIRLSVPKIYEILGKKYTLRSKKRNNVKRGAVPEASGAREVVQMDTILLGSVFVFTAVDIFSKEADVYLAPALTDEEGATFLQLCMTRRFAPGRVALVQTDGGSEFKGAFTDRVGDYCDRHRVARPYKKNEQSFIESFNRTVRSECLVWSNYRPHQIPELTADVTT